MNGVTNAELRCKICTLGYGTYIYDIQSRTYCTNNQFANRVQNCQAYDINLKCIKCKNSQDYDYGKFDFGLGVEINGKQKCYSNLDTGRIPNCWIYDNDLTKITCFQCNPGYFIDDVTKKCVKYEFPDCYIPVQDPSGDMIK